MSAIDYREGYAAALERVLEHIAKGGLSEVEEEARKGVDSVRRQIRILREQEPRPIRKSEG